MAVRQVSERTGPLGDRSGGTAEVGSWPTAEVGFSAVKDRKLCVAVVGVENLAGRNRHIATR